MNKGYGYRVGDGYVEIVRGVKLDIIGWDGRYDGYPSGNARLTYEDKEMMLWISKKIPKLESYTPKDVIGVDVNEGKIVYGGETINSERNTKVDRAERFKVLAELLQKKHPLTKISCLKAQEGYTKQDQSIP